MDDLTVTHDPTELAHDVVTVARAMFTFLRPGSPVSVPVSAPVEETVVADVAPVPPPQKAQTPLPSPATPTAIPVPVVLPPAPAAPDAGSRSMVLLNEIAFLDD